MNLLRVAIGALAALSLYGQAARTADQNLPAQPLGNNDLIAVSVYDAPEFSRTVRISADGYIRLPMVKERIKAVGLEPSALETAIADTLKREDLIVDPYVTVTVAEYHSRPISVAGAVKLPVVFQAEGPIKLLEALARAQGLSEAAGPDILVTRPPSLGDSSTGSLLMRVPIRGLIDNADASLNLVLTGGEEIRVPEVAKVYVMGNVKKPNEYRVREGGQISLLQLLALAEGLAPYAAKEAYIYRREAGSKDRTELKIPLRKVLKRESPDVMLSAEDILYVPESGGKKLSLSALERIVAFGTTAGATALIYAGR